MFATKREAAAINLIMIGSLSVNDWLLAAFMLAKKRGRAL